MNMFAGAMARGYLSSMMSSAPSALMNLWKGGAAAKES